jgi:hypothetical protein
MIVAPCNFASVVGFVDVLLPDSSARRDPTQALVARISLWIILILARIARS